MSSIIPTSNNTHQNEIITEALSSTPSALSSSSLSFCERGGTLKRNIKGKSDVWLHFQIYNEKKFNAHAFCLLCKSDVKYGQTHSTTNLEKHLQRNHEKEYKTIMVERAKKKLKVEANSGVQTRLATFFTGSHKDYEEYLLHWMIDSYQPLSAVQKASFHHK
jgi:hypothetical protein